MRNEIETWQVLASRADELATLRELIDESGDTELARELERDGAALLRDFERERTQLLFSGEYDDHYALLTISAGAGGTEATDWAEMLLRMYLRWAERRSIQDGDPRPAGGRAGGDQERDGLGRRAVRLRLAARERGRPSARPDQPVRRAEPAPDHVRPRRSPAPGRGRHRDRDSTGTRSGWTRTARRAPAAST